MSETTLGGRFAFPGTDLTVHRIGYGAMQLAGPGVFGPPRDPDAAIAVPFRTDEPYSTAATARPTRDT